MSKDKPKKKKVVVTKTTKKKVVTNKKPAVPRTRTSTAQPAVPLTFGRDTYIWMGIGVALIALGLILMSGGGMPSPDVWDADRIYGFRRTVLAPMLILAGLGLQIYAIFRK